jgi:hypothetical protein
VEAVRAQVAERPQRPALVPGVDGLGGILDDAQAVLAGDGQEAVHRAGDAGVVDGEEGAGAPRDGLLDQGIVQVKGVRPDVHEDRPGPQAGDGVGGGDEGERRQDDLVAGPQVAQQGGHFQGRRAGRDHQDAVDAEARFQEAAALLREGAVAADVAQRHRPRDVVQLLAGDERLVEGDLERHPSPPPGAGAACRRRAAGRFAGANECP